MLLSHSVISAAVIRYQNTGNVFFISHCIEPFPYAAKSLCTSAAIIRYQNTGKVFFIGHWEGDWAIRDVKDANSKPNPTRVKWMIEKLSDKQRGVDDAKKYNPKLKNVSCQDVGLLIG